MSLPVTAVLYQAINPPVIDGVRKPKKESGYADSGADIAYSLRDHGVHVATPVRYPDPHRDLDWVFPDTAQGIAHAIELGATILWLNTVLFEGHPIEDALGEVRVVGHHPATVHRFDDKWVANCVMRDHGLPVPAAALVGWSDEHGEIPLAGITTEALGCAGLEFPVVLKPLRGRGSQGVVMVETLRELISRAEAMLNAVEVHDGIAFPKFGHRLIVEAYLEGMETTITVLPPVESRADGGIANSRHLALPPIERFGQAHGIMPYSGDVPVSTNSRPIADVPPGLDRAIRASTEAAVLMGARSAIRVDCRERADGEHVMFDINLKPNMTGAGRPGRDDQDGLVCMAAKANGWSYVDLLHYLLSSAWNFQ